MATFFGGDANGANVAVLTGVTWPNTDADDVAFLIWTMSDANTPITPSGFTLLDNDDDESCRSYLFWKVCTGSESGDVPLDRQTATRQSAALVVYRGMSTETPTVTSRLEGTTGTTHACPQVTFSGSKIILTAISERLSTGTTTATAPSGFTRRAEFGTGGSGGTYTGFADNGLTTSTSPQTPAAWTGMDSSGASVVVRTIAVADGTTAVDIAVNDATHSHAAESPTITQVHELAPADATHSHSAESPTLTQVHEIAPADATHSHEAESPTVLVVLGVDDATHGHSAESPTVTQVHSIAPADATHAHTADSPTLTQAHVIAPADAEHGHTAESPAITQTHVVSPADCEHGHTAESPSVDSNVGITAQDATHGHAAESPTLIQVHVITVADALHAHVAESPALTQLHVITVGDAAHAHEAESPAITQLHLILADDATHDHAADSPTVADFSFSLGRAVIATGAAPGAVITSGTSPTAAITQGNAPTARITT